MLYLPQLYITKLVSSCEQPFSVIIKKKKTDIKI